jgi:hypothetical protein
MKLDEKSGLFLGYKVRKKQILPACPNLLIELQESRAKAHGPWGRNKMHTSKNCSGKISTTKLAWNHTASF